MENHDAIVRTPINVVEDVYCFRQSYNIYIYVCICSFIHINVQFDAAVSSHRAPLLHTDIYIYNVKTTQDFVLKETLQYD